MIGHDEAADTRQWHELLDALCTEQGHLDNMVLAEQLCAAGGNQTQPAFEAALKNLRNWRLGVHIPQRRNFLLLGKILGVERNQELREQWNRLYGQARSRMAEAGPIGEEELEPASAVPSPLRRRSPLVLAAAACAVLALAGGSTLWWLAREEANADPVASYEGVVADYVRNVSLKVGESAIIHGARGNECGPAPSWESAKELLPELVTGTLTDGGVGTRNSRQCGGRVPARAILYTALKVGTEQTSLYGDDIVIRVTE